MSHEIVNSSPILLIFNFYILHESVIYWIFNSWLSWQMEEISEASLSKAPLLWSSAINIVIGAVG